MKRNRFKLLWALAIVPVGALSLPFILLAREPRWSLYAWETCLGNAFFGNRKTLLRYEQFQEYLDLNYGRILIDCSRREVPRPKASRRPMAIANGLKWPRPQNSVRPL